MTDKPGMAWPNMSGNRLLGIVIALVIAHRAFLIAAHDFVINDGALFLVFVQSIARGFPYLPQTVEFNGLTIPFAYPPLGFWLGALLTKLGASAVGVIKVMPIILSLIYTLLFALLLRRSGRSAAFAAIALLFFALNQRSFEWLIMGGGMSRSLGAVFLISALIAIRIPEGGKRLPPLPVWPEALAGLAVGGAILSHLEWGLNAAAAVILSGALGSPTLRNFVRSMFVSGTVALLTILPWLAVVLHENGTGPFLAASGSGRWEISAFLNQIFGIVMTCLTNPLFPLGIVIAVRTKRLFWPLFFLLCLFLTPRHGYTPAALPMAVLSAQGLFWLAERLGSGLKERAIIAVAMALVLIAPLTQNFLAMGKAVRPLNKDEIAAMTWVRKNHANEAFFVLSNLPWWSDRSAEWFPFLTGAHSVNTVQGREWLPDNQFARWFAADKILKSRPPKLAKKPSEAVKLRRMCTRLHKGIDRYEPTRFIWVQWGYPCFNSSRFRLVHHSGKVLIYERVTPAA